MLPHKPVKMQQNRGSDNQVINFGHFAEAHKVKAGPDDIIAKTPNDPNFDKYTAEEMAKLGYDGSCFPKDTRALFASFKNNKVKSTLIKSVIDFNEERKFNMVKKV